MVAARFALVCLIWLSFTDFDANGMFALQETKTVPIERLLANLQQRWGKNTNDFQVAYQLARVHAMAYATNLTEVAVKKDDETQAVFGYPGSDTGVPREVAAPGSREDRQVGQQHLTNAIVLYERAIVLLKHSTNAMQEPWMILRTELGLAWCLDQAGRRDEAIQAYQKVLRIAWRLEVVGKFDFAEWVRGAWREASSGQNPIHARHSGHLGPGVCYSQEVIGYLLKLLDPVKDAAQIAQLKKDQQTLLSLPRAITPILIPLESGAALADLVDTNAQVAFDLDGSGLPQKWAWITPKAAWLVYDPDGRGQVKSGLQLFGSVTFWIFWRDGYEALSALDDNADGVLSGAELKGLALWIDANGNGVSEPGEVIPVEALGITSIGCSSRRHVSGIQWNPAGVGLSDGTTRPSYDWVAPASDDNARIGGD